MSSSQRGSGRHALTLGALALWLVVVPMACMITAAMVARQEARTAALGTEAAGSLAELTAAIQRQATETSPVAEALLVAGVVPATATSVAPSPIATGTATPSATATATASPAATDTRVPPATATASPSPAKAGELVIGYSVAGRPLTVTVFGNGPVVRLIVAGIHGGNEWNTIALGEELIAHLREQPARVPADVTLYILPALNPDGAARGTGIYARANENNVDLNRNWPSRWQADWSRNGCWKYLRLSGGTQAGSEPETQALMQFLVDYHVDAVINYHSAALGIFAGGQPPDEASERLAEAVAAVSDYPYPPLDFGCVYTGQLIDWAAEHGIAALDIELTNHRDTDFKQNLRILDAFLNWRR